LANLSLRGVVLNPKHGMPGKGGNYKIGLAGSLAWLPADPSSGLGTWEAVTICRRKEKSPNKELAGLLLPTLYANAAQFDRFEKRQPAKPFVSFPTRFNPWNKITNCFKENLCWQVPGTFGKAPKCYCAEDKVAYFSKSFPQRIERFIEGQAIFIHTDPLPSVSWTGDTQED
jgi:hypothetical protein